jgi:two-component system chemotaxis response regulator CheB
MSKRNIIVIGASIGGFEALKRMVSNLPADLPATIFIVWHMSAEVKGILPEVLTKIGTVQASTAVDNEPIKSNHIYVAPPDHHMIIEEDRIRITRGPKENRFRPAIDPLFRAAAYTYKTRVIGMILSGALDDGTAGLWKVKSYGGIAMVQDPKDAENPSMPRNALKAVKVDFCLPIDGLTSQLVKLCVQNAPNYKSEIMEDERDEAEIAIAAEKNALKHFSDSFGKCSPYSCPECHGVMSEIMEDHIIRYRCHTGHAYSANTLLKSLTEKTEDNLYNVIRGMDETVFLLNHTGDHYAEANEPSVAAAYFNQAKKTFEQSNILRAMFHSQHDLSLEDIYNEAKQDGDSVNN